MRALKSYKAEIIKLKEATDKNIDLVCLHEKFNRLHEICNYLINENEFLRKQWHSLNEEAVLLNKKIDQWMLKSMENNHKPNP